jgi:hypothetical protein
VVAVTILLLVAAPTTVAQGALGAARNVIETGDDSLKGRLVGVDPNWKRSSHGVSKKAQQGRKDFSLAQRTHF